MLALNLVNLDIVSRTVDGDFSISIPFEEGLNIIRAENSSGKSTCVNAIAYGLGLEAILGPSRKRPFPKSLYDVIFKSKSNEEPYNVIRSYISLKIKNEDGLFATLTRDVKGSSNRITIEQKGKSKDYFLGSAGPDIGSAKSELGFHNWLAKFIGWNLPNVVTFDGRISTLYLECIFPLFFIEQKRGWSEIQANTPTHYRIKNLKKSAAEFCLAIDSFEHEKKIALLQGKIDRSKIEWEKLRSSAEGIADFNCTHINKLPEFSLKNDNYTFNFSYLENNVYIDVDSQEKSLNKVIDSLSKTVKENTPNNEALTAQSAVIRVLRREIEKTSGEVEMLMISISEADKKITTLKHDYGQYRELKRLKNVGGDISSSLNTEKCPICENELYDTLGNNTAKREPMSLDENIDFLKNQLDFFGSVKEKSISHIQDLNSKIRLLNSKFIFETEKVNGLREDLNDVNGATRLIIREKLKAEILLNDVLKLKSSKNELNDQATRLYNEWSIATGSLSKLKKGSSTTNKNIITKKLEDIVQNNLEAFKFNRSSINDVTISNQTLRPEQDGYDIVAETSASDYIRIIWSYTLALLELAGMNKEVKHGGFVVFDEPRQHEASKVSFASLISKASESRGFNGQVIFSTSLDRPDLAQSCKGKNVNIIYFDDYILSFKSNEGLLKDLKPIIEGE